MPFPQYRWGHILQPFTGTQLSMEVANSALPGKEERNVVNSSQTRNGCSKPLRPHQNLHAFKNISCPIGACSTKALGKAELLKCHLHDYSSFSWFLLRKSCLLDIQLSTSQSKRFHHWIKSLIETIHPSSWSALMKLHNFLLTVI